MKILRNKHFLFFLGFLLIIGIWFLVSLLVDRGSMIFPSPIVTFKEMFILLGKEATYKYLGFSIVRLIIGFFSSLLLAFLLGILVNRNEHLYQFFTPLMTFLKAAPTATFTFLFLVLLNGQDAPIFVVIFMTFPILYESIVGALKSTSETVLDAAKVDGANRLKTLFYVQLPLGMPYISLGIVSTFGLAFKVEIMAEIIMGLTKGGLGAMIYLSRNGTSNLTRMFAYSLMAIILVLLVSVLTSLIKGKLKKLSSVAAE